MVETAPASHRHAPGNGPRREWHGRPTHSCAAGPSRPDYETGRRARHHCPVASDRNRLSVLVTGGAGYIGRFCVRRLLEAGHDVVVLDRRALVAPDGGWPAEKGSLVAVEGDIADAPLVRSLLQRHRAGVVLHLAAAKSVAESMAEPGPHLLNNVSGSLVLLEAMRAAGVSRMVFSSSAAVYGTPDALPVPEDAPLRPENPYGAGKVMVEQALHWYTECHGFDSVSLRYFNAAGGALDGSMGEDSREAHNLVPRVMRALSVASGADGALEIYGTDFPTPDGTAVRDYVHVEDLAAAHVLAVGHVLERGGESVFNLGTGRGNSVREVIAAAERASGRPVPHTEAPRRPGDPAAVWADVRAAAEVLGWRAELDLDDIMASAWLWHSRQQDGGG